MTIRTATSILILLAALPAASQIPDTSMSHDWPYTEPRAVACRADTAYVLLGPTLRMIDFTEASPVVAAEVALDPPAWDMVRLGDHLVTVANDGLRTYALQIGAQPMEVGFLPLPGFSDRYFMSAGHPLLLFSYGGSELALIDAQDPTALAHLGDVFPSEEFEAAVVIGDTLVIGGGPASDFYLYDISTPSSPMELDIGMYAGGGPHLMRPLGEQFVSYEWTDVFVYGWDPDLVDMGGPVTTPALVNDACVEGAEHFVCGRNYVGVMDFSTPTSPVLSAPWVEGVMASLLSADRDGDAGYVTGQGFNTFSPGVHRIDLTDPMAPQRTMSSLLPSGIREFCLDGDLLVTDEIRDRLNVYRLSEGVDPVLVGTGELSASVWDMELVDGLLVASCYTSGLFVFTLDGNDDLQVQSTIDIGGNAQWIDLDPPFLHVLGNNHLSSYDLTDPASPVFLADTEIGWSPHWVEADGDRVYVNEGTDLMVFVCDPPGVPTLAGTLEIGHSYFPECGVEGDLLASSHGASGVKLIDVSSAASPTLAGTVSTPESSYGVQMKGDQLWALSGDALLAYDVSDTSNPVLLGSEGLGGRPMTDMAFSGRTLLVGGRDGGFMAFSDASITPLEDDGPPPAAPPARTVIAKASPNPFNPTLAIEVDVAEPGAVLVSVHDLRGRRVAVLHDGPVASGSLALSWDGRRDDGREAPSGMYVLRVVGNSGDDARRVTLAR